MKLIPTNGHFPSRSFVYMFVIMMLIIGVCYSAGSLNRLKARVTTFETILDSGTYYTGSTAYNLSYGEDVRFVCKADDTTTARLGADSINFEWGYQTGTLVKDTGATISSRNDYDTLWGDYFVIDTMCVDSFGVKRRAVHSSDGSLTHTWLKSADTLDVDGFACQKRWVIPEWDEIIRAWVRGLGTAASASGQSGDSLRGPYIEIHRRTGVNLDAD